jgi:hypothetical protein
MLPALIAVAAGAVLLHRSRKKQGLGNLPSFDIPLEAGYSYWGDERFPSGHSWSYMRLSPEFQWHEKPIAPHNAYTDLAVGRQPGTIQSDPYHQIDYKYDTGVDYYRTTMPYEQVPTDNGSMGGQFAGPNQNAFASMINSATDKVENFIKGW